MDHHKSEVNIQSWVNVPKISYCRIQAPFFVCMSIQQVIILRQCEDRALAQGVMGYLSFSEAKTEHWLKYKWLKTLRFNRSLVFEGMMALAGLCEHVQS